MPISTGSWPGAMPESLLSCERMLLSSSKAPIAWRGLASGSSPSACTVSRTAPQIRSICPALSRWPLEDGHVYLAEDPIAQFLAVHSSAPVGTKHARMRVEARSPDLRGETVLK